MLALSILVAAAGASPALFAHARSLEFGDAAGALALRAGDLDGDGDPDLVVASSGADTVSWFENLGGGAFGPLESLGTGAGLVLTVDLADLDADGDLDAIAAAFADDLVYVFENLGGPTFGPGVGVATAEQASDARAADVDGDGDPDLVVASFGDDEVTWHENVGGVLQGPVLVAGALDGACGLSVGDLDLDGAVDVVVGARRADDYAWVANTGGTFGAPSTITNVALGACLSEIADLDDDGLPDVLVASPDDDTVAWFGGLGGGFGPEQVISTAVAGATTVRAADLDGDGDLDAAATAFGGEEVVWFENLGAGAFAPSRAIDTAAGGAHGLEAADLDGDGDLDLVATTHAGAAVHWYENLGPDTDDDGLADTEEAARGTDPTSTDTDLDGRLDPAEAGAGTDPLDPDTDGDGALDGADLCEGHGDALDADADGTPDGCEPLVFAGLRELEGTMNYDTLEGVDLDGDGDFDLVAASDGYEQLDWFENLGRGRFAPPASIEVGGIAGDFVATDVDLDGAVDLVVADWGDRLVAVYAGLGGGQFASPRVLATLSDEPESVAVGDLDDDGDPDVVFATSYELRWCAQIPGGFATPVVLEADYLLAKVHAVDLDGDGDTDVVAGNPTESTLAFFENRGAGLLARRQLLTDEAHLTQDVEPADLDGDGDLDLLAARSAEVVWFENAGDTTFGPPIAIGREVTNPWDLHVADLDGNGLPEVIASSFSNEGYVTWYPHLGGSAFGVGQPIPGGTYEVATADFDGDGDLDVATSHLTVTSWIPNLGADLDGDGLAADGEAQAGTDPLLADTDGDGLSDNVEVRDGTDPLAPGATLAASLGAGVTVTIDGGAPGSVWRIRVATDRGSARLSFGGCAGTRLGLDEATLRAAGSVTLDATGHGSVVVPANPAVHGRWFQAFDSSSCDVTNVDWAE